MEINSVKALQNLSPNDGHITFNDLKKIDTDSDGNISQQEAATANIDSKDLSAINQAYNSHKSKPNEVIFNKAELEAKKLQSFVQNNFKNIDQDKDGFLSKGELNKALSDNRFSAEDKQIISKLKSDIGDLEEYSNDEWGDENDGITLKDMNKFVQEKEGLSKNLQRSKISMEVDPIVKYVKDNFKKLDQNNDGFISKGELDKLIHSSDIKGDEAAMISGLRRGIEDLEEYSNDEWFDENDGITIKDINKFLEKAQSNPNDSTVNSILSGYKASKERIDNASHDLYANSSNPLASINVDNITQGTIGDCFFISAVAGVAARDPQAIKDMIKDNNDGTYTVKFPGAPKPITVKAPSDGEIGMYATSGKDGMWLTLLEKAYAQLRNASSSKSDNPHNAIDGGDFQDASIKLLTGHKVNTDSLTLNSRDTTRKRLMSALNPEDGIKRVVTASTFADGDSDKNLASNHVYTILSYDPKTDTVKVRNPWGAGNDAKGLKNKDLNDDGTFTMTIGELDDHFSLIAYEEKEKISNYDHLGSRYWYKFDPF